MRQIVSSSQNLQNVPRRAVLHLASSSLLVSSLPNPAHAGLVLLPANRLNNQYYLIRAGESVCEAEGRVCTNPAFKTSLSSGLSTQGRRQVALSLFPALEAMGATDGSVWLWPSVHLAAYQTAEILAALMDVGRSRIVPEYSFLDPRGVGGLENGSVLSVLDALSVGDASSPAWRPPRGFDGTPPESVADVLVRVQQLLSLLETQYSGANVLIVSPDSDNLSVLQAAVRGVDLRQHRQQFGMGVGEVRPLMLSETPAAAETIRFACPKPPNCFD